ncbi:hypothetical protein [Paenibacillus sp. YN15]|uniref:hypothetical protein n=1 Tax=Paenibacillus sp. YN15 TaxID=1742774 RepID=UPI000DCEECF7|nr:hypothetical protein [Paenibacillus sp. YN15]RAV02634.1 hypothetical protein DQG13_08965 [Paenibacillus sp. YN15]
MRKSILAKFTAAMLVLVLLLSGGTAFYSYAKEWGWAGPAPAREAESAGAAATAEATASPQAISVLDEQLRQTLKAQAEAEEATLEAAAGAIELSGLVLEGLQRSNPQGYKQDAEHYKRLLAEFHVHEAYRTKLDDLLASGAKAADVLTAYEFAYRQFGSFADVESLLALRQTGRSWAELFAAYLQDAQEFVPQAFDSDYLETLLKSPRLTADDIMIADQISFKTGKPFKELINSKLEAAAPGWREQCAAVGLLFSGTALPRVSVTEEQLKKFTEAGVMSEEQVVEAFVLAGKLGQETEPVIAKLKKGTSEAALYEEAYALKYDSVNSNL